ncbi:unnamed protein product [Linum trigynum]|uniref:Uncharacterized protein n=1 Tax=Linum trigynum TaxID=586398 RepID=A0AAV2F2I7_9ROSI
MTKGGGRGEAVTSWRRWWWETEGDGRVATTMVVGGGGRDGCGAVVGGGRGDGCGAVVGGGWRDDGRAVAVMRGGGLGGSAGRLRRRWWQPIERGKRWEE